MLMNNRWRVMVVGLCAFGLLISSPAAHAATYHVGKSGCSNSGPGSKGQPFCTINKGISKLSAGDKLQVGSGVYNEQVKVNVSGSSGKPVVIEAAPGAKPIIDGSGKSHYEEGLINISNRSHVTLRGLTVRKSSYYCMAISGSKYIVVEKMLVDTCYHGGIVFDQYSENVKALNNEVKGTDKCGQSCGTHEAITISQTTNFTVAGNYVHHGIKEGIDAKDESSNGQIYNNTVANMGQVGIYLNHCQQVKIYHNNVHHNGSSGFQISVGDYAMGSKKTINNEIYQNQSWANSYSGMEFWTEDSGDMGSNKIYNNVFHGNAHYGIDLSDDDSYVKKNVIRNNIISSNSMGGISGDATSANTISHNLYYQTGSGTPGANKVTGDPKVVNAAKGDFHLTAGSPAMDKGFDMGLPKKGLPDIGRHEYGLTAPKLDSGPPPPKDTGLPPNKDSSTPPPIKDGQTPPKDTGPVKPGKEAGTTPGTEAGILDNTPLKGSCGCDVPAGMDGLPILLLLALLGILGRVSTRR